MMEKVFNRPFAKDRGTSEISSDTSATNNFPDINYLRLMDGWAAEPKGGHGGIIGEMDPGNPLNWPWRRKVFVSVVASGFAFTAAFGLTSYALSIDRIMAEFHVSRTLAILPFSVYLWGIAFAPIYTPHLTERLGRAPVYFISIPFFTLFAFTAARAPTFTALVVMRFLAGFFAGPSMVLVEGTYADVWSVDLTVSYYSVLSMSSYVGAAAGPVITAFIIEAKGWRWSQYTASLIAIAAYLMGIGMPETYAREIVRSRARRSAKRHHNLPKPTSGVTFGAMAKTTLGTPLLMLVSEPIVVLCTLYVSFAFATVFQFFVLIPAALAGTYAFTLREIGTAFSAAIAGAVVAAMSSILLNRVAYRRAVKKNGYKEVVEVLEHRLIPAMLGGVLMTGSLFWIAFSTRVGVRWVVPVLGTMVFVWGNMMVLASIIPYLFNAYPPAATLSALTAAATTRLIIAGLIPLLIFQDVDALGPRWALSIFGIISAVLGTIPFVLYWAGKGMRLRSTYGWRRVIGQGGNGRGLGGRGAEMGMGGRGMERMEMQRLGKMERVESSGSGGSGGGWAGGGSASGSRIGSGTGSGGGRW